MRQISILFLTLSIFFSCTEKKENVKKNRGKVGVFYFHLNSFPTTLNPLSSTDYYASQVQAYIIDSMATRNVETNAWQPALAESWTKDPAGKYFDFKLRKDVKWHDGKALTAEDIKFSFDAIVHPENKYKTAHMKPYYENISSVEIINPTKVRFNVKKVYFKKNYPKVEALPHFEKCLSLIPKGEKGSETWDRHPGKV